MRFKVEDFPVAPLGPLGPRELASTFQNTVDRPFSRTNVRVDTLNITN